MERGTERRVGTDATWRGERPSHRQSAGDAFAFHRAAPRLPQPEQVKEELLMDFATWLVVAKPGGRWISPATARKHVSTVQAWHAKQDILTASLATDLGSNGSLTRWLAG